MEGQYALDSMYRIVLTGQYVQIVLDCIDDMDRYIGEYVLDIMYWIYWIHWIVFGCIVFKVDAIVLDSIKIGQYLIDSMKIENVEQYYMDSIHWMVLNCIGQYWIEQYQLNSI